MGATLLECTENCDKLLEKELFKRLRNMKKKVENRLNHLKKINFTTDAGMSWSDSREINKLESMLTRLEELLNIHMKKITELSKGRLNKCADCKRRRFTR